MSAPVYRRCGCREANPDANGRRKQLGGSCPQLASDPKHGTWSYDLSYGSEPDPKRPGKTRRRQLRAGGFKTKREAQTALIKLRAQLDVGSYTEPSKTTLAEYAREVIERRRVNGTLKPTTMANYRRYVEQHIVGSRLGAMRLTDCRHGHLNVFLAELTKAGRGAVTVRRVLAVLRMVFSTAVRDEILGATQHSWRTSQQCPTPILKPGNQPTLESSCSGVAAIVSARCTRWPSTRA